jgi:hypothetical protein
MKHTPFHAATVAPKREGFTSLEFMVAIVVLGVALAGLFPLMAVSSRGIESLELRYTAEGNKTGNWYSPVFRKDVTSTEAIPRQNYGTWYVVPSSDPWANKLGAAATFSRTQPAALASPKIIDNGDPTGYAVSGSWTAGTATDAFHQNYQQHAALALPDVDTALWAFSNVSTGYYYVLAKWPAIAGQATDAAYTVYDGDDDPSPVTVTVNQTVASNSSVYSGWTVLTRRYFRGDSRPIKVVLRSNADKPVAADGVRIVPVSTILSIDKAFNTEEVTVRVKIGL